MSLKRPVESKLDYDRKTVHIAVKVKDRVLLFDESVRRGRSKKLSAQWIGPYTVLAVDGVNATIKRGRNTIKVHVNKGTVNLYNTMWKTIVYVDLKAEDLKIDNLGSYINHVDRLCNSVEVKNWTECSQFRESVSDRFRYLQNSERLLKDTVGKRYEDSTQTRDFKLCGRN